MFDLINYRIVPKEVLTRSNLFPIHYVVSTKLPNPGPTSEETKLAQSTVDGKYETFDTEYRLDNAYNITNDLHDYAQLFVTYLDLDFQMLLYQTVFVACH